MPWSTALREMVLCLTAPLVAIFGLYPMMTLPLRRGEANYYMAATAALAFFLLAHFFRGRGLGRGTLLFLYASFFGLVAFVSVFFAHLLHVILSLDLNAAGAVVFVLMLMAVGLILLYSFVVAEDDESSRTVAVQRGRKRFESAPNYLYADTFSAPASQAETERAHSFGFEEDAQGNNPLQVSAASEVDEDDPEVFARFRAYAEHIPEADFDENFVYDARRPNRIPLKKDSIYRKFFELQQRKNS